MPTTGNTTTKNAWRCLLPHSKGPLARSSHAIAIVATKAYLFGGENVPRVPVCSNIFSIDLTQPEGGWKAVEAKGTPPSARIAPALAAIGSVVYVFGGRMGIDMSEGPLDDLHSFDTKTGTWTEVMTSTEAKGGPSKRSFHQMVAYDGKLYVFGGCGPQGRMHDLHCFDPSTSTWDTLPLEERMRGRGGAALTANNGKIIMLAGFAGEETRDMWAYDIKKKIWEDWSAHSVFTLLPVGAKDSSTLVLFGGEVDPSSEGHQGAGGFAGDTLALDLSTQPSSGFVTIVDNDKDAPSPRGWYAAGLGQVKEEGPYVYVLSGGLSPTNERLGDLWVLEPLSEEA